MNETPAEDHKDHPRFEHACKVAQQVAARGRANAYVVAVKGPARYDVQTGGEPPTGRGVSVVMVYLSGGAPASAWQQRTAAAGPIPRPGRKTYDVYDRADTTAPLGQVRGQARGEAAALAIAQHGGGDPPRVLMIAVAGPNSAAEIDGQLAREAREAAHRARREAGAKAQADRRHARDRKVSERERLEAARRFHAAGEEARQARHQEEEDRRTPGPSPEEAHANDQAIALKSEDRAAHLDRNRPCTYCGGKGDSAGQPPRCCACLQCSPAHGLQAEACPGLSPEQRHQAEAEPRPPGGKVVTIRPRAASIAGPEDRWTVSEPDDDHRQAEAPDDFDQEPAGDFATPCPDPAASFEPEQYDRPATWHAYRDTPDGRLWAGGPRLAQSQDPAPKIGHRSAYFMGTGKAIRWETRRRYAEPHPTRSRAAKFVAAQGWPAEDINTIRSDQEPPTPGRPKAEARAVVPFDDPLEPKPRRGLKARRGEPAPPPNDHQAEPGEPIDLDDSAEVNRRAVEQIRAADRAAFHELLANSTMRAAGATIPVKHEPRPYAWEWTARHRDGTERSIARVASTVEASRKAALRTRDVESVRDPRPLTERSYSDTYGSRRVKAH